MGNPFRGEVEITLGDVRVNARLTLGALAELEEALGGEGMAALLSRFESGQITSRDVLAVILAALRGGGWKGEASLLLDCDICGGPLHAARAASLLVLRAFGADDAQTQSQSPARAKGSGR